MFFEIFPMIKYNYWISINYASVHIFIFRIYAITLRDAQIKHQGTTYLSAGSDWPDWGILCPRTWYRIATMWHYRCYHDRLGRPPSDRLDGRFRTIFSAHPFACRIRSDGPHRMYSSPPSVHWTPRSQKVVCIAATRKNYLLYGIAFYLFIFYTYRFACVCTSITF